jgi:hypothetical protein
MGDQQDRDNEPNRTQQPDPGQQPDIKRNSEPQKDRREGEQMSE